MNSQYSIEALDPPRFPLAKQFYKQANYHSHVGKGDEVYVLRDSLNNKRIVAAVRLVKSDQYLILRSMVVLPNYQRQGLGSILLQGLEAFLGHRECWCYPFEWLDSFYSQINFKAYEIEAAPPHIANNLNRYRQQGRKLILMRRGPEMP